MSLVNPIPEPTPIALTDEDRQRLFESHELLAYHAAGRFRPCGGLNRDDYRQAARIGLHKAAKVFDPERGLKFSTLAYRCCKNEIVRTLRLERPGVHIPVRWQDSLARRAKAERAGEDLPAPNKFEIAAEAARHTFSLDGNWDEGQRPREAVESGPSAGEVAERAELTKVVREHLADLPRQLGAVLMSYYGIDCQSKTLLQVGEELGVSQEMARQLRNRALRLLRKQM